MGYDDLYTFDATKGKTPALARIVLVKAEWDHPQNYGISEEFSQKEIRGRDGRI